LLAKVVNDGKGCLNERGALKCSRARSPLQVYWQVGLAQVLAQGGVFVGAAERPLALQVENHALDKLTEGERCMRPSEPCVPALK